MKFTPNIRYLGRNLQNIPGWHTKRKIVVIESDDWGSIRMSSRGTYDSLRSKGYNIDNNRYEQFDALESNEDIEVLFDALLEFKDFRGNYPVITANNIVGNPDFDKIRDCGYKEYYYEPFTTTYNNYPNHDRVLELLKKGLNNRIFKPQFHGRDHVNVAAWLSALQNDDKNVQLAFSEKMISFYSDSYIGPKRQYMDALHYRTNNEKVYVMNSLIEGLHLFRQIWGFDSKSFIAPCYLWDSEIEDILMREGVIFLQGVYIQYEHSPLINKEQKKYHFTGQQNHSGQFYLVRNAVFEPSSGRQNDPVGNCLREISIAFKWKRPAIICSHRVNYIGGIFRDNRTKNINLLKQLLTAIIDKWPDVEFMSSDQLGMLVSSSIKD
jgi:hypothetical protein